MLCGSMTLVGALDVVANPAGAVQTGEAAGVAELHADLRT